MHTMLGGRTARIGWEGVWGYRLPPHGLGGSLGAELSEHLEEMVERRRVDSRLKCNNPTLKGGGGEWILD